jgi:hypothetical protein
MVSDWDKNYNRNELEKKHGVLSNITKQSKPNWFSYLAEYKRLVDKETKDLLNPRGINLDSIPSYILNNNSQIEKLKVELEFLKSEDFISKRTQEIILQREKDKITLKSVEQLVSEFATLNNLLSIKRLKSMEKPKVDLNVIFGKLEKALSFLN